MRPHGWRGAQRVQARGCGWVLVLLEQWLAININGPEWRIMGLQVGQPRVKIRLNNYEVVPSRTNPNQLLWQDVVVPLPRQTRRAPSLPRQFYMTAAFCQSQLRGGGRREGGGGKNDIVTCNKNEVGAEMFPGGIFNRGVTTTRG